MYCVQKKGEKTSLFVDLKNICVIFLVFQNVFFEENVGLGLVSKGLALPQPFDQDLVNNKTYTRYYKQLLNAESSASKKQLGIWQAPKPKSKKFFQRLREFLRK